VQRILDLEDVIRLLSSEIARAKLECADDFLGRPSRPVEGSVGYTTIYAGLFE
jgi:hypothetical protein